MTDDAELLRCYAQNRSEAAFAELVRRHIDLVYSAALPRVGRDAHLAEDVTQSVFRDLACKALPLSKRTGIAGWLYRSARFAAADLVRSEQRRQKREQEAHLMNELNSESAHFGEIEQLRPILEESIDQLESRDREAVLLRFFEKRPFSDIGALLGVTEDTAQKRVDRALDKLRALFARRGVTSTASALTLALTERAASAAPIGLAASVSTAAISGLASGGGSAVIGGFSLLMSTSTSKAVVGIVVIAVGAVGLILQRRTMGREGSPARELISQQTAAGLEPKSTAPSGNRETAQSAAATGDAPVADRTDAGQTKNSTSTDQIRDEIGQAMRAQDLRNSGWATPFDAVKTSIWSLVQTNREVSAAGFVFADSDRPEIDQVFADLPQDLQRTLQTPEAMLAAFLMSRPVSGVTYEMTLDSETENGPDDMILTVRRLMTNKQEITTSFEMKLGPDHRWRRLVPKATVDLVVRSAANGQLEQILHGTFRPGGNAAANLPLPGNN